MFQASPAHAADAADARPGTLLLIVTRPAAQAAVWVDALQALGWPARAFPLLGIAPVDDATAVRAAASRLGSYRLVMFVSANAVVHFMAHVGADWPDGVLAGSTGPGTSKALAAAGVPAQRIVQPPADAAQFDSEALWSRLAGDDWAGRRVLVVRGEDGRDWLAGVLRERGAAVDFVAAYRRQAPTPGPVEWQLLQQALQAPQSHLWLFSSSEAVGQLQGLAPAADWRRGRALASHPRIAEAARALGFGDVRLAPPDPAAVAAIVAQWAPIQFGAP